MAEANRVKLLAEWLQQSKGTVVLTGAGMSTESGIPDFRSREGWWKNIDPTTVATVDALEEHYDLFHEFYATRIRGLEAILPHRGHELIADWERRGLVQAVVTQNVDGLHHRAGSRRVFELHGDIRTVRCHDCERQATVRAFLEKAACAHCGGRLRPNVVLFGEMLPQGAWRAALQAVEAADLVLVIGTSLQVYPVAQLPSMTKGRVAILNREATGLDDAFDLVLHGQAGEWLQRVEAHLS
jgi:NAD-dependent deacetylase